MFHTTRGIVFHSVKYSESSLIVKIYTEFSGIQSYLFKGIRRAGSRTRPALFQPLTLLTLEVNHREKQSLQHAREVHLAIPYQSIPFDIRKSSLALFINELVYKTIREEEPNADLFDFLWNTCLELDTTSGALWDFHLLFAMRFCHFLGIFPMSNYSEQSPFFNLREGLFQPLAPDHPQYLDPGSGKLFFELLVACGEDQPGNGGSYSSMGTSDRDRLLETILLYYRLHLPGFKGLQSHHILHDVLA